MGKVFYDNLKGFSDLKYDNGVLYGRLEDGAYVEIATKGEDGEDGVSFWVYVAYAVDALGDGFSLIPSDSLKYRAEIHTQIPITNVTYADFANATWVKYIGDDGKDGTGNYLYIAYASDSQGSNFSLTQADGLNYNAILITDNRIENPTLADFEGVPFVQYKFPSGGTTPTDISELTDNTNVIGTKAEEVADNKVSEHNTSETAHSTLFYGKADTLELANYLPRSGGTMTGSEIKRNVTNSFIVLRGGTSLTTGATFAAFGSTSDNPGMFQMSAHDGTASSYFQGHPDGRLLWRNNPVTALPAGTVAGTLYVGASREFTTIAAALDHIRQSSNGMDKVWNILLDPGEYSISGTITGLRLNIAPVSGSYSTDCRIVGGVTFQDSNITLTDMHIGTESLSSGTASILVNCGYFVAERCVFYAGANTVGYSLRFDFCATGQVRNCKFYAPTATTSGSFSSLILHYNSSVYLSGSEGAFIGTSGVTNTYAIQARSNSCVFLYGRISVTNFATGIWCRERSCCFGQSGSFTFSGVTTNSSPADGVVGNDNSYINI